MVHVLGHHMIFLLLVILLINPIFHNLMYKYELSYLYLIFYILHVLSVSLFESVSVICHFFYPSKNCVGLGKSRRMFFKKGLINVSIGLNKSLSYPN